MDYKAVLMDTLADNADWRVRYKGLPAAACIIDAEDKTVLVLADLDVEMILDFWERNNG